MLTLIKINRSTFRFPPPKFVDLVVPDQVLSPFFKQEGWFLPKTAGWPTAEESLLLENFSAVIVDKDQSQINAVF